MMDEAISASDAMQALAVIDARCQLLEGEVDALRAENGRLREELCYDLIPAGKWCLTPLERTALGTLITRGEIRYGIRGTTRNSIKVIVSRLRHNLGVQVKSIYKTGYHMPPEERARLREMLLSEAGDA